jgi:hypothetical protein
MVYILTHKDFDFTEVEGVFTSVEKAKSFADTALGHKDLNWSEPNRGRIWANTSGGTFVITAMKLNPTES